MAHSRIQFRCLTAAVAAIGLACLHNAAHARRCTVRTTRCAVRCCVPCCPNSRTEPHVISPAPQVPASPDSALPADAASDVPPVTDDPRPFTARDPIRARRPREGDYLSAVSATRFYVEYQTIINSIHQALMLYYAEFGEYPRSHDEFMEKIIRPNQLPLPELPAGQEYIFVPEEAELGLQIRLTPAPSGPVQ